jgi:hypothetical protein
MDWKYKQFGGVQTYPHSQAAVLAAARGFVAETLRWAITDTADGFKASGVSFAHAAVAVFRVDPAAGGARLTVELTVERMGYMGLMLFDVGGYYNGQIAHWLERIGDRLEGRAESTVPARRPSAGERFLSWSISVAAVVIGLLAIWNLIVSPLIGITTGVLYLTGRGGDATLHGAWARGVSAALLTLDALIAVGLWRWRSAKGRTTLRPE